MKGYSVREVFNTLQGEGLRAGSRSVFVRLAGCNLWTGREADRAKGQGACAAWCDTDFAKGERMTAEQIVAAVDNAWLASTDERWVVLTGGEPCLQIDQPLIEAFKTADISVAVETNGTVDNEALALCDHVCLSPKLGSIWGTLSPAHVHEVKVVLPGGRDGVTGWSGLDFAMFEDLYPKAALFVQPCDFAAPDSTISVSRRLAERSCIELVQRRPRWRLSIQVHKLVGLP